MWSSTVADPDRYAAQLRAAFGFGVHGRGGPDTGQAGERTLLLRQGRIQILLRSGLTAGHPAARYVSRHGDGVAVVAFGTDDVESAFAEAVAGGADPVAEPSFSTREGTTVGTATVCGFGDVQHRFIQRSGPADEFAPGVVTMSTARPAAADETVRGHRPCGRLRAAPASWPPPFGSIKTLSACPRSSTSGSRSAARR